MASESWSSPALAPGTPCAAALPGASPCPPQTAAAAPSGLPQWTAQTRSESVPWCQGTPLPAATAAGTGTMARAARRRSGRCRRTASPAAAPSAASGAGTWRPSHPSLCNTGQPCLRLSKRHMHTRKSVGAPTPDERMDCRKRLLRHRLRTWLRSSLGKPGSYMVCSYRHGKKQQNTQLGCHGRPRRPSATAPLLTVAMLQNKITP